MRIDRLLASSCERLAAAGSPSARLDAEVLLGYVLDHDRTWLYTWSDREVGGDALSRYEQLIVRRSAGEPVAYLTGEREFWGLRLRTVDATLIPRPDTESLIEAALVRASEPTGRALDLGTGSGAIALAFASERPGWRVIGVDRIPAAVALARDNAARLGIANAAFLESDWFAALAFDPFTLILSNPPYLADDDPHLALGDVRFEPRSALVAADDGLADLRYLVTAAQDHLVPGGWLLLEHGMTQGAAVRCALRGAGYDEVATLDDLQSRPRVSLGRFGTSL